MPLDKVSFGGLTEAQAQAKLTECGFNELVEKNKFALLDTLVSQFSNFTIYVLLAAALISLFIGETINFAAIIAIIVFVICLGCFQEYRAEKSMQALKKIVQPTARVYRGTKLIELETRLLVPGDVILLETGDKVSADAQIFETTGLKVDESALTGESAPVEKKNGAIVFAGTLIVHGKCKAFVQLTGMSTKLGSIAGLIQTKEVETPLQRNITSLGKTLSIIAMAACALTFVIGVAKGAPILDILIIALALAVAAVPEGLPLTLTLTLAYGMQRMARSKAIVRKMLAVETLGSVTVICTDKTGTLTKNEMTVEKIFTNGEVFYVNGAGYSPKGEFYKNNVAVNANSGALNSILLASTLCTNAELREDSGEWKIIGDPTEAALVVAGAKAGLWKDNLGMEYEKQQELEFTSERKLMTVLYRHGRKKMVFSKGAPENLLEKCAFIEFNGKVEKLTAGERVKILAQNKKFAFSAFRTLAVAYKELSSGVELEENLVFLGLVAMRDPPREEVKQAIATCQEAGIKIVMITGDNEETACAICRAVGLPLQSESLSGIESEKLRKIAEDHVITGAELNELNDVEFSSLVDSINIYARIMPEQKLRIVSALKQKGHIVAMTGDGINDAPALKKADIGVAMGLKGTEVARESSSIVLQDDNFATIVCAVEQGRAIYNNIEKFTVYLTARNFTEVILILLGIMLLGFNYLPLIALQILLINTFGEILPALSLGLDAPTASLMKNKPRKPNEQILKKRNLVLILCTAAFIALACFLLFTASNPFEQLDKARTLTFAAIISTILFLPFAFKSLSESIFKTKVFSNKLMVFGSIFAFCIMLVAIYSPLNGVFRLTPLLLVEWLLPLSVGLGAFVFVEMLKKITSRIS
ncbi:MAG: cation-translocating P-type ATPase [Candidatus Micrarchaeota archaeon]